MTALSPECSYLWCPSIEAPTALLGTQVQDLVVLVVLGYVARVPSKVHNRLNYKLVGTGRRYLSGGRWPK